LGTPRLALAAKLRAIRIRPLFAIERDAGIELPDLRESLGEMQAGLAGRT
jgi:hypothetical protein